MVFHFLIRKLKNAEGRVGPLIKLTLLDTLSISLSIGDNDNALGQIVFD